MTLKNSLWTTSKARLQLVKSYSGSNINWIFLPGGPGLGSESLKELTNLLNLPGNLWHLDLPGDGSNGIMDTNKDFNHWAKALVEAVEALSNVVLVAHSTGGMYCLATKELEGKLKGLILMDSAPDASWQQSFGDYAAQHPIENASILHEEYMAHPNNETLKLLTTTTSFYLSDKKLYDPQNFKFLETLPYNYLSCNWSAEHFDTTYKAEWVPKDIPTLIFAGNCDHITPLHYFQKAPEFQRENIAIRQIDNAGHFPWIENPAEVVAAFEDFSNNLTH